MCLSRIPRVSCASMGLLDRQVHCSMERYFFPPRNDLLQEGKEYVSSYTQSSLGKVKAGMDGRAHPPHVKGRLSQSAGQPLKTISETPGFFTHENKHLKNNATFPVISLCKEKGETWLCYDKG